MSELSSRLFLSFPAPPPPPPWHYFFLLPQPRVSSDSRLPERKRKRLLRKLPSDPFRSREGDGRPPPPFLGKPEKRKSQRKEKPTGQATLHPPPAPHIFCSRFGFATEYPISCFLVLTNAKGNVCVIFLDRRSHFHACSALDSCQRFHFLLTNHKGGSNLQFVDRSNHITRRAIKNILQSETTVKSWWHESEILNGLDQRLSALSPLHADNKNNQSGLRRKISL